MHHSGFVRNYDAPLRALVARGHEVHISYEVDRDKLGERRWVNQLAAGSAAVTFGVAPSSENSFWARAASLSRVTRDYLRYFDPRYARTPKLRERVERLVPVGIRQVAKFFGQLGWTAARVLDRTIALVESAAPPSGAIVAFLREQRPDVVLVTPLVDLGSGQVDYIKAARALGIPTALCVASWDNLTNKGVMRVIPDRVLVWNDAQRDEAITLHGARPQQIVVTGAQIFDHWFDRQPSRSREEFCRRVGVPTDRPFVLYLGSSFFLCPNENEFADRWIATLRASASSVLRDCGILLRSHPLNPFVIDVAAHPHVAIWPKVGALEPGEGWIEDYFDSLYYSAAVVGVNTSALIEAAILRRVVCTVCTPDLQDSQEGTLHFEHLARPDGGLLRVATTLEEHVGHLDQIVTRGAQGDDRTLEFVRRFVRPAGMDQPATPRVVAAIEELRHVQPRRPSTKAAAVRRVAVRPLAAGLMSLADDRPLWGYLLVPLVALFVRTAAAGIVVKKEAMRARRTTEVRVREQSKVLRRAMRNLRRQTRRVVRAVPRRIEQLNLRMRLSRRAVRSLERVAGGQARSLKRAMKASRKSARQAVKRVRRYGQSARRSASRTAHWLNRRAPRRASGSHTPKDDHSEAALVSSGEVTPSTKATVVGDR